MTTICLIPGDGIGTEVVAAAKHLLEATNLDLEFASAEAGWGAFERHGRSVPEATFEVMEAADATLVGAFASPSRKVEGFTGAIRVLRRKFDMFANLRPAKSRPVSSSRPGIDMLMVRENTEGLYAGAERRYGDMAIADCVVTRAASERIAHVAMDAAAARSGRLHVIHKANVLNMTSGLFLDTVLDVGNNRPDVEVESMIVDVTAMKLVTHPESFDVLVTTNLFGDILSDLMAGLVGGLGLAPSANIGKNHSMFEPVHGTAPDIAGQGIANPMATFLSASMMLEHLGHDDWAKKISRAVDAVLIDGPTTPDLGGKASTQEVTSAVIAAATAG